MPSKHTMRQRRLTYGLTQEIEDTIKFVYGEACNICLEITDDLQLDHCHKTGRIRGFLCRSCNMALGGFRDDVDNLQRAIMHLSRRGFDPERPQMPKRRVREYKHPRKLDEQKVREIRASKENAAQLARKYGVSRGCITGVLIGQNWKWVI